MVTYATMNFPGSDEPGQSSSSTPEPLPTIAVGSGYGQKTQPRRRFSGWLWMLLLGGGALALFLIGSAWSGKGSRGLVGGPRIGVIEIKGEIGGSGRSSVDADEVMAQIDRFKEDSSLTAVLIRIDSPGGAVAPSQEIHDELKKLAKKKKVVCSMGNLAASGGLYIAVACPTIFAEPGTLTGSIGVISMFPNFSGLAERLSVRLETIKSGKFKDAGNAFRDMTPDERAYWQALIDSVYKQFVRAVASGRNLTEEKVKGFADGRVLTGEQALAVGLIDKLGNLRDAADWARDQAGAKGEPKLIYAPSEKGHFWEQLLSGATAGAVESIGAELQSSARQVQLRGPAGAGLYYKMQ